MSVAVVQGGGGSIGAALARQLLIRSRLKVVACSRNPAGARQKILEGVDNGAASRLTVLELDGLREDSVKRAAADVAKIGKLRILLNASGVLHADKSVTQVNMEELLHSYQLNTFCHILVAKHFLPLLPSKAEVRNAAEQEDLADGALQKGLGVFASLTARVGSIGDNKKGGWVGYRSSKAATNQVIATIQRELLMKSTPSIALALHPGTVVNTALSSAWTKESDAGKKPGVFHADESAECLLDVIAKMTEADGGRFVDWAGKDIDW